ncbi:MAG: patatin-like phospholipase family protein [Clostridia bacterium]|nr:patatin-like phospholipase family protein [Clostridia bacterium]
MRFFRRKQKEFKRNKNVKIGLALGGGATRGFAHIGAFKAFEEAGIEFDFVAGTSAGSLAGAMYASGMKVDDMINIASNIREKDIKLSKIVFVPSKTDGIENLVKSALGDIDIQDLPIPFSPIVVDLKSTEEIALRRGNLAKAIAGSCAIPGVFVPVEFEDKLLADGGLQNTIPADIPKLFGCDYVVAIDVNSTRAYGTNSSKVLDVMGASIRILMKSNAIKGYVYSEVMVTPDLKRFKSTSVDGMAEMIEEGYKATLAKMPEILELFTRKPLKKKYKKGKVFASKQNEVISNEFDVRLVQVKASGESAIIKEESEVTEENNN